MQTLCHNRVISTTQLCGRNPQNCKDQLKVRAHHPDRSEGDTTTYSHSACGSQSKSRERSHVSYYLVRVNTLGAWRLGPVRSIARPAEDCSCHQDLDLLMHTLGPCCWVPQPLNTRFYQLARIEQTTKASSYAFGNFVMVHQCLASSTSPGRVDRFDWRQDGTERLKMVVLLTSASDEVILPGSRTSYITVAVSRAATRDCFVSGLTVDRCIAEYPFLDSLFWR